MKHIPATFWMMTIGTLAVLARGARDKLSAAVGHLRGAGVVVQELAHG